MEDLKDIIDAAALWKKEKPEERTMLIIARDNEEDDGDVTYFFSGATNDVVSALTQTFCEAPGFKELTLDAVLASDAIIKSKGKPDN